MPDVQHASLRPGAASGIHVVHAWEAVNAAARLALTTSALDVGKVCRQLDDGTYWVLTSVSGGATWRRIDSEGAPLSDATPLPLGTAHPGDDAAGARADHIHAHGTQAGGTLHALASADAHGFMPAVHFRKVAALPTATVTIAGTPVPVTRATAAPGVSTTAAASDHKHDVTTGTPVSVGATNEPGSGAALALANHIHAHGTQAGGTLHAEASPTTAGFMPSAHFVKVRDLPADAGPSTPLSTAAPSNVTRSAALPGGATSAAKADHKHDVLTGVPVAVGAVNSAGSGDALALANHVHDASSKADKHFNVIFFSTETLTLTAAHAGALLVGDPESIYEEAIEQRVILPTDATLNLPIGYTVSLLHGRNNHYAVGFKQQVPVNGSSAQPEVLCRDYYYHCADVGSVITAVKIAPNLWSVTGDLGTEDPEPWYD